MNRVERILATVGLEATDRPPVMPVLLMQGARALGVELTDYFKRPSRLAEGQLALVERFDPDAVFAIPHIVQDVLPWGSGLDFHPDGPPSVNGMVIPNKEAIPSLKAPDPTAHAYLRSSLRAAERLAREVKGERLIVGAQIGPFSLPTMLMGTRKFLELLLLPPAERRRWLDPLMEVMLKATTRWGEALFNAGCDVVVVAEGIASAAIITPELFSEVAAPVIRRHIAAMPGPVGFEFVGPAMPMLPRARDLGAAVWLLGEEDPVDRARTAVGRSGAIMGTFNNLKLLRWHHERVEFEARRLIDLAGPGFILSNQGPEVPWATPDANIEAIVRAAHRGVKRRAA